MLLEEFDVEKYERTLRDEGREDGFRDGLRDGLRDGRACGFRDGYEEAVRKMLLKGMTVQQVADILELSEESVEIVKTGK